MRLCTFIGAVPNGSVPTRSGDLFRSDDLESIVTFEGRSGAASGTEGAESARSRVWDMMSKKVKWSKNSRIEVVKKARRSGWWRGNTEAAYKYEPGGGVCTAVLAHYAEGDDVFRSPSAV
jgi:hypothetical protein